MENKLNKYIKARYRNWLDLYKSLGSKTLKPKFKKDLIQFIPEEAISGLQFLYYQVRVSFK